MFDFDVNAPLETISPLTFAYVGDAVHELYVRTMLAKDKNPARVKASPCRNNVCQRARTVADGRGD